MIDVTGVPRPRVLIFQPALAPYRLHIYNEIAKHCELKVIFLRENLLNQKFDQSKLRAELKIDYEYLTTGFTIGTRSFRFGINKKIDIFSPDVVITVEFSPVTIAVSLSKLIRGNRYSHVIWTDDNLESVALDNLLRRMLRPLLLPLANGIIVVSEEAALMYSEKFNFHDVIGVVPIIQSEQVFTNQLVESAHMAAQLQQKHGLQNSRIILFVGRMATEKRIGRLLEAMLVIKAMPEYADVRAVLVGDGPELVGLKALAEELKIADRVLFVGRHEGVALVAWYRLAAVFVLPSAFERFGAVVNEALLAGVPVICSTKVGARELIRHHVNGEVVDCDVGNGLVVALAHWLRHSVSLSQLFQQPLRPSLMPVTFQDAVYGFLKVIREVSSRNREAI